MHIPIHVTVLLINCFVWHGATAHASTQSSDAERIEIVGAKTPASLPDYFVWEYAFRLISRRADFGGTFERSAFADLLPVTTTEQRAMIYATADRFIKEQRLLDDRLSERAKQLASVNMTALFISNDAKPAILEHRRMTLDAADHLLSELPPDVSAAFNSWVQTLRRGITVSVSKADLAFFGLPR